MNQFIVTNVIRPEEEYQICTDALFLRAMITITLSFVARWNGPGFVYVAAHNFADCN